MSIITTLNGSGVIATDRTTINTNFTNLNSDKIETSYLDTDTALTANSDSKIATQKAVKTYVDTQGGANASTTVRGVVEEATQAEVNAGTASGGTGARLFINPSTLATKVNSLIAAYVPAFVQELGLTVVESLTSMEYSTGSMNDGSAFFVQVQSGTKNIYRFGRDSVTGAYTPTHVVAGSHATVTNGAFVNVGVYLYHFYSDGANMKCDRYLAADLTGVTAMTVPTFTTINSVGAWTDGTFIWVVCRNDTTSHKLSISGTTLTDTGTTGTVTSNAYTNNQGGSHWNGTNAYYTQLSSGDVVVLKLTNIDGSTTSSSTVKLPLYSDAEAGTFNIYIDATRMYVGKLFTVYNATAAMSTRIVLYPITTP